METTVADLIAHLSDLDPDAVVRLATQPNWPLAYALGGIATSEDISGENQCSEHGHYNCEDCQKQGVVWLVEGNSCDHPYAPRAAWDAAVAL